MLLYLPLSKKIRLSNVIIIIFSLLFYASFGTQNLSVLIVPLFLNYVVGMSLPIPGNKERKILLALSILGNVGILVYYKYFNFLLGNLLFFLPKAPLIPIMQQHASFIIPVGVSFIIFQGVSYLVDVYRKKTPPEKNFIRFATYASIFPHLIAGPIVRYSQIKGELSKRKITSLDIFNGFKYFTVGLFFKVAIADQLFTVENLLTQNTTQ
ncbi:MAG: hypothetical protein M1268_04060, partial [Patescibacteria group bacterium]|nr:hypothetical protein [Patescibacteria group bacterium]